MNKVRQQLKQLKSSTYDLERVMKMFIWRGRDTMQNVISPPPECQYKHDLAELL